jgi:predicted dehydrogenase
VRWTEQRNIKTVLELMERRRLDVATLTTHRIPHVQAVDAYRLISNDPAALGVVLQYQPTNSTPVRVIANPATQPRSSSDVRPVVVGMIGAGGFARAVLLPALARTGAVLDTIVSSGGLSAAHAARRFGFRQAATDYQIILNDDHINTVFITTRHHQHAPMVAEALAAGKHVFVEKPLAIDAAGLAQVSAAYQRSQGLQLAVGFNRRFSPHTACIRRLLVDRKGPLCLTMLVNAGAIPADHWIQDPQVGGGRIAGEGCHWIDLLRYLVDAPITSSHTEYVGEASHITTRGDHCCITLGFSDGSIGAIHYFANGHRAFPKERLTVFSEGRTLELDNFRSVVGYGWRGFRRYWTYRQDKGHRAECQRFVERVAQGGELLIPFDQLVNVTQTSLECELAVRS